MDCDLCPSAWLCVSPLHRYTQDTPIQLNLIANSGSSVPLCISIHQVPTSVPATDAPANKLLSKDSVLPPTIVGLACKLQPLMERLLKSLQEHWSVTTTDALLHKLAMKRGREHTLGQTLCRPSYNKQAGARMPGLCITDTVLQTPTYTITLRIWYIVWKLLQNHSNWTRTFLLQT